MNAKHTGATKLPNQPKMSATDLKKAFDAPSKDVIAPKFNGLIDELEASTAAINIGAVSSTGTKVSVQFMLNQIDTKGDMKTEEYDPSYRVLNFGGIPAYISNAIIDKANVTDLAEVAFSGKYADLNDIPEFADVAFTGKYTDLDEAPYDLSYFRDDSTHRLVTDAEKAGWDLKSTVSVSPALTSGARIASVVIDDVTTNIYAPESGAGSGDMKKSDYDADEAVKLAGGIKAYVSSQISTAITSALTASY